MDSQKVIKWQSHAIWPKGTYWPSDSSTDEHWSEEEALAVCKLLQKNGFGGDRKIFPLKTWVEKLTSPKQL